MLGRPHSSLYRVRAPRNTEVNAAPDASVARVVWHSQTNQVICSTSAGGVRVMYDPAISDKGAKLSAGRSHSRLNTNMFLPKHAVRFCLGLSFVHRLCFQTAWILNSSLTDSPESVRVWFMCIRQFIPIPAEQCVFSAGCAGFALECVRFIRRYPTFNVSSSTPVYDYVFLRLSKLEVHPGVIPGAVMCEVQGKRVA